MEVNWQREQQKGHFKIGELIGDVDDEAQIRTFSDLPTILLN